MFAAKMFVWHARQAGIRGEGWGGGPGQARESEGRAAGVDKE